jgi:hypothetical protein
MRIISYVTTIWSSTYLDGFPNIIETISSFETVSNLLVMKVRDGEDALLDTTRIDTRTTSG